MLLTVPGKMKHLMLMKGKKVTIEKETMLKS